MNIVYTSSQTDNFGFNLDEHLVCMGMGMPELFSNCDISFISLVTGLLFWCDRLSGENFMPFLHRGMVYLNVYHHTFFIELTYVIQLLNMMCIIIYHCPFNFLSIISFNHEIVFIWFILYTCDGLDRCIVILKCV